MKSKRFTFALIALFILSMGYNGINQTSASVSQTGLNVLFKLKSVQVIDDCDSTSVGDWHLLVFSAIGQQLYYSGEVSITDNGAFNLAGGGLNLPQQHYNPGAQIKLILRAVENDNLLYTDLAHATDCDSGQVQVTFNIGVNQRNAPISVQQGITDTGQHPGSQNVRFNFDVFVYDNPPIVSTPANLSFEHGISLNIPNLSVTNEDGTIICDYDFDYTGAFTVEYTVSNCGPFTLASTHASYPNSPGTYTYAVRAKDAVNQYSSIVTGTLTLTNTAPNLNFTSLPKSVYQPNEPIPLNWNINDRNIIAADVLINGTVSYNSLYPFDGLLIHGTSQNVTIASEGIYNITIVATDLGGLNTSSSQMIEVLSPNLSGLNTISPNGGDFINSVTIQWDAVVDNYGNQVTYSLFYSQNDGATYYSLVSGLTNTSYIWDTTSLERGLLYKVKVEATSISGTIFIETPTFHLREVHTLTAPSITGITSGMTVTGNVTVAWSDALDNWNHTVTYDLAIINDGTTDVIHVDNLTINSLIWDTTAVPDGSYSLVLNATDGTDVVSVDLTGIIVNNTIDVTTQPTTTQSNHESSTTHEDNSTNDTTPANPLPGFDYVVTIFPLFIIGILVINKRRQY